MHVRIAWEIYHHQAKQNPDKAAAGTMKPSDMLRPHMYQPPPSPSVRPHEMPQTPPGYPVAPGMPGRGPFDALSANFLGSPSSHLGNFIAFNVLQVQDDNFMINFYRSFTIRSLWNTLRYLPIYWFITICS